MLNSVQILRAMAAWLVVFSHYIQIFGYSQTNIVSNIVARYGSIGVDIFFVISGFVIYTSVRNRNVTPLKFLKQRIARIVPAYWLFTLLTAATVIWLPSIIPPLTYENIFLIKSLFFIPSQNPSGLGIYPMLTVGWTLNYEAMFYAIFFFSLFLPRKLLAPAIFSGVIMAASLLPKLGAPFSFYATSIFYEFLLGIIAALIYQSGILTKTRLITAMVLLTISISAISLMPDTDSHDFLRLGLPCAIIVMATISQEKYLPRLSFLTRLGDFSYSTYLVHPIIIWYMLSAKNHFDLGPTVALIIICTLTVSISWISFNNLEVPISKLCKKSKMTNLEDVSAAK